MAIVIGVLAVGFFLFLSFMPTPSRTIRKASTANDRVRYTLFCLGQARFDWAVEEFEKAFKMKASYGNRYRRQLAKVFLERGKANLSQQLDMAIGDFERARSLDLGNHEVYFQLGKAFTKCGKHEDALNQYEQFIAVMANNADAHFNLGYIFLARKEYTSAAREIEEVIRLKPPYLSDAYVNLGIARYNAGHLKEALMALKKALQLNPQGARISSCLDAVKAQLGKEGRERKGPS